MQKENQLKSYYKNNLSSREVVARDLPHPTILSLLNRKQQPYFMREAEDPRTLRAATLSGMTPNFMGFTLIELLVVVLIIGILAAVALPQYTQAVEKSRFATYQALVKSIAESAEALYLANGTWANSFDELSTELPADMNTQNSISHSVCRKNSKMFCCIVYPLAGSSSYSGGIWCGNNDYHMLYGQTYASTDGTPERTMMCTAKDTKYKKICKAISNNGSTQITYIPTPDGWKEGYLHYFIN